MRGGTDFSPWRVWRAGGGPVLRAATLTQATALAERQWHAGLVVIAEHETHGERHRRIAGTWHQEGAAQLGQNRT